MPNRWSPRRTQVSSAMPPGRPEVRAGTASYPVR
jgi:hypothetical protein